MNSSILAVVLTLQCCAAFAANLPGTKPLTMTGDIASNLVAGVDKFLLREIDKAFVRPAKAGDRERLAHILGVRDARVPFDGLEYVATTAQPSLVARGVHAVRWPAFGDVHGEGLLFTPTGKPVLNVVAIPDADQTPEQFDFAARLAASGCRVVVPVLIDRHLEKRNNRANVTSREFLYRSAFELGRHLIGYEVQKVLAVVDWLAKQNDAKIAVAGHGEGGMLALYAAALDTRIDTALVSGYFDDRRNLWQEPVDRNVFGLLNQFRDADLAAMIAPRKLIIAASPGPELTLEAKGGAPGRLVSPKLEVVKKEFARAAVSVELALNDDEALTKLLRGTGVPPVQLKTGETPVQLSQRQARQFHEIDRHNQWLLRESEYVRKEFMKKLDTSSLEKYQKSVEWYRNHFYNEVIGKFDQPLLPANPRTRLWKETDKWTAYEVVLDVFPDVIAYGILLLPKDIKPGDKRPVVVCQHGLEGRPEDTIIGDHRAYHDFTAKLAERGFITFAPQNLYIFGDRFRTLQRKANPLGKTLFSIIVPQHQQITDWLKTLPAVDPQRIAFYGLSYGGKSAMRIPPLVDNYCLSICSGDFNEWVAKNASTRLPFSYVWTGEYEIFEFDLGSTFNYAEMAALIAPRPFMVERGHFDGCASDEVLAYEFAKVRHLYQAKLGIGDRCEIEWFVGGHMINSKGTFDFLHKHLRWPKP
jgi:dienelactone hydrolase